MSPTTGQQDLWAFISSCAKTQWSGAKSWSSDYRLQRNKTSRVDGHKPSNPSLFHLEQWKKINEFNAISSLNMLYWWFQGPCLLPWTLQGTSRSSNSLHSDPPTSNICADTTARQWITLTQPCGTDLILAKATSDSDCNRGNTSVGTLGKPSMRQCGRNN